MQRLRCTVVVVVFGTLLPLHAFADPKSEAKRHIDLASALHENGRFEEALVELEHAYALDPQPKLLYAIGQVHVQLGRCSRAIEFYNRFLATNPDAKTTAITKQAIASCENQPDTAAVPVPAPVLAPAPAPVLVPVPVPVPASAPWYADPVGDILATSGIALGVVGAIFYAHALGDLDDVDTATDHAHATQLVNSAHHDRELAVIFGAAAALAFTAAVIRYATHDSAPRDHHVAIAPSHGGGLVTWSGHF